MPKQPPDNPAQTRMELTLPGECRCSETENLLERPSLAETSWTTSDQVRLQGIEAARLMGYYPDYADIDWLVSVVRKQTEQD